MKQRAFVHVAAVLACVLTGWHQRDARVAAQDAHEPGVVLVASIEESRLDFIDERTGRTLATVPTGKGPHEVRVAPDGKTAYVVAGRTITAVDIATRTVRRTLDLGEFSAHDVRVSADGRTLWAACAGAQTIVELDAETGKVLARHSTGRDGSWFVEVAANGAKLYTPNMEGKSVSVITRSANAAPKVLSLDFTAYGIDITRDGQQVWVSGQGLTVIDTATDAVRAVPTTDPATGRLRITPDDRQIVVAFAKSVAVFDRTSARLVREIPLQAEPKVLALSTDGQRAYLTNPEAHSLSIIDIEGGRVLATLPTGRRPDGVAWVPAR